MKYRDILGYSKKQPKKKVVEETKKPSLVEDIKQELNEWNDTTFKQMPKRWSKPYGESLTEFEKQGGKDNVNEGPAYEYANYVKKINKSYDQYWDAVKEFQVVLDKKGLKGASKGIGNAYKNLVLKFHKLFEKMMRKLV